MLKPYLAVLLAMLLVACDESRESYYSDRAAAVADGAFERGWLPDWLPGSATDIAEWHDLDTNHTIATFAFGAADPPSLPPGCRPLPEKTARSWAAKMAAEDVNLRVLDCPDGPDTRRFRLLVGIDYARHRAYIERVPAAPD